MPDPARLLRNARRDAGLTQAELAARLGITQPAVAAMERPGANPTVRTLDHALAATGHRLQLVPARTASVDERQIRERLALTPTERLRTFQRSHRRLDAFTTRARRVRAPR